jgi:hypothetical protein
LAQHVGSEVLGWDALAQRARIWACSGDCFGNERDVLVTV